MTRTRLLGTLGCAALVGLGACGGDRAGGGSPAEARVGPPVAAPPPAAGAPVSPVTTGVLARLEGDGLVRIVARRASRRDFLNALVDAAGFVLVAGPEVALDAPVTLPVERESLEIVLARLLAGVPHALIYEKDPASSALRLTRVTLGVDWTKLAESTAGPPQCREGGVEPRTPGLSAHESRRSAREQGSARVIEAHVDRTDRDRAGAFESLQGEDDELRSQAVRKVDVSTSGGFEAARRWLADDESPLVRAAAAKALTAADEGALRPLLQALKDSDPRVVLAALEALEAIGDASVLPELSPLLEHSDGEVRREAQLAIELFQ